MRIWTLGTGGCFPTVQRGAAGALVKIAEQFVLVDAGENTGRHVVRAGVEPENLSAVFLTHFHTDHTAGLAPLLFGMYAADRRDLPLTVFGPPGLGALRDGLVLAHGEWLMDPGFELIWRVLEPPGHLHLFDGVKVIYRQIEHAPSLTSLGYAFEHAGQRLTVAGDAILCDGLRQLAENADVLLCEAGYPTGDEVPVHLTPTQLAELANESGVRQLVLTHFAEPQFEARLIAEAKSTFAGELFAAHDGDSFEV